MQHKELDSIIRFMVKTNAIKETKRSGWVVWRLPIGEHVADHSFSTALLSYIFAQRMGLDADWCMAMALMHDIHESITGDIATNSDERKQTVTNKRKQFLEHRDTLKLLSYLPNKDRKSFLSLWRELEEGKTREAKLVKEIDALDYIIELLAHAPYNAAQKKRARDFFVSAGRRIKSKDLVYIYKKAKLAVLGKD